MKRKNKFLRDGKIILFLSMKECVVDKVDGFICELKFDKVNSRDE